MPDIKKKRKSYKYSRESYLRNRDKKLAKAKLQQAEKVFLVKSLKEMTPDELLEWIGFFEPKT